METIDEELWQKFVDDMPYDAKTEFDSKLLETLRFQLEEQSKRPNINGVVYSEEANQKVLEQIEKGKTDFLYRGEPVKFVTLPCKEPSFSVRTLPYIPNKGLRDFVINAIEVEKHYDEQTY